MTIMQALITFAVLWWLLLFMALPVGVKMPKKAQAGHAPSAPEKPNLRKKFKWVTIAALMGTLLAYFLLGSGYVSL